MQDRIRQRLKRKNETIAFRVTTQERERLEDAAVEAGMSLSAYLAAMLDRRTNQIRARLAQMQRPTPPPIPQYRNLPPELISEFRRIGNNLNQIAHAVNSGLPPEYRNAARQLKDLLELIEDNKLNPHRNADIATRTPANSSQDPTTRSEFQRRVQVRPKGPWEETDR